MSEFKVGDKVRAKFELWDGDGSDMPIHTVCDAGDLLEVRRIGGGTYPITVAHPHREPGAGFGVKPEEIKPI